MFTPIECPSCGNKKKVPDAFVGKKVRCRNCNSTFVCRGALVRSKSLGDKVSEALDRRVHYSAVADTDYSTVSHYPCAKTLPHKPVASPPQPAHSPSLAWERGPRPAWKRPVLWLAASVLLGLVLLVVRFGLPH
jgi:hypothetical protein